MSATTAGRAGAQGLFLGGGRGGMLAIACLECKDRKTCRSLVRPTRRPPRRRLRLDILELPVVYPTRPDCAQPAPRSPLKPKSPAAPAAPRTVSCSCSRCDSRTGRYQTLAEPLHRNVCILILAGHPAQRQISRSRSSGSIAALGMGVWRSAERLVYCPCWQRTRHETAGTRTAHSSPQLRDGA